MGVGLHVGERYWEVGTGSFLHAFFSTVAVRLERERWGGTYPVLMRTLYGGALPAEQADAALHELDGIERGLSALSKADVVWDAEDRSARPPWGDDVAPTVTNLANYWVTSDGRQLLGVLRQALTVSRDTREAVEIE